MVEGRAGDRLRCEPGGHGEGRGGDRVSRETSGRGWVRDVTGFAIGGVAPLGHLSPPLVLVDEDLFRFDRVWAAAGSPMHVFATTPGDLLRLSGGQRADVKEGG